MTRAEDYSLTGYDTVLSLPSEHRILVEISKVSFILCSRDPKDKILFFINIIRPDLCIHQVFVLASLKIDEVVVHDLKLLFLCKNIKKI